MKPNAHTNPTAMNCERNEVSRSQHTLEAMNQNTEVNGETMQTRKFMGHERKQWKQAQSNNAKLQESVLQSFNVYKYMLSVLHNN